MSLTFNLGHKVEPMYASESKIRSNTSTELTTIVAPKSVFAQVVELIRHGQALESKYGDISTAPRQFTEKIRTEYRKIDSELESSLARTLLLNTLAAEETIFSTTEKKVIMEMIMSKDPMVNLSQVIGLTFFYRRRKVNGRLCSGKIS